MRRKRGAVLVAALMLSLMAVVPAWAAEPPETSAEAVLLAEASTGRVLYEKNSRERLYPASITKILTALVALEYLDPQEIVTVGAEINDISLDSSKAGHLRGESISVENLLRGLLITSGNDTANVLAVAAARKTEGGESLSSGAAEDRFVELMNEKAAALGCTDTHFVNAHGYQDPDHYTTAYDLYLIVRAAMGNDLIMEIARETNFSGNGLSGLNVSTDGLVVQDYAWKSHNSLIMPGEYYYEYATGMKTGYTDEAGSCIAATAGKDGVDLIAIVLKDQDPERWVDTKNLFEYGFGTYGNQTVQTEGDPLGQVGLSGHNRLKGDTLDLVAGETATLYLSQEEKSRLQMTFRFNEDLLGEGSDGQPVLKAPLEEGQAVGWADYSLDGKVWLSASVKAGRTVEKQTLWTGLRFFLQNTLFTSRGALIAGIIAAAVVIAIVLWKLFSGRRRHRGRYLSGGYSRRKTFTRRRWK